MILTTIALVAQASPAATASPAYTPIPGDSKADAIAKAWFVSLQHGKLLDKSALTTDMAAGFTPKILAGFEAKIGPLGVPTSFKLSKSGEQDGTKFYIYDVAFKTGDTLRFAIAFDANGKISGMRALPPE
jgi:hypothetical protein